METTEIKIVAIGHLPAVLDETKIENWSSSIFKINGEIEHYSLTCDSDGPNWEFTDVSLLEQLPKQFEGDFLLAIVSVPIESNWYTRRLDGNKVVFSFHEIKDILASNNIPLENVIFRLLYSYMLIYKRHGNKIPTAREITNFAHDETRGCLFDMNGIKSDIIYSCDKPIICPECVERLKRDKISDETIYIIQKEIRKIRKPLFYRLTDLIKKHPVWSMIISALSAIVLGTIGSLLAALISDAIK